MENIVSSRRSRSPARIQSLKDDRIGLPQPKKLVRTMSAGGHAAATATFAIAAIPDAAFAVCCKAHHEAYRHNVILMPYSMTVPYLLALYRLHIQYAGPIDTEKLTAYLGQLEDGLRKLDDRLESVQRGATIVANAYRDGKNIVGGLRQSIPYLQASAQPQIGPGPGGPQPAGDTPPTA